MVLEVPLTDLKTSLEVEKRMPLKRGKRI